MGKGDRGRAAPGRDATGREGGAGRGTEPPGKGGSVEGEGGSGAHRGGGSRLGAAPRGAAGAERRGEGARSLAAPPGSAKCEVDPSKPGGAGLRAPPRRELGAPRGRPRRSCASGGEGRAGSGAQSVPAAPPAARQGPAAVGYGPPGLCSAPPGCARPPQALRARGSPRLRAFCRLRKAAPAARVCSLPSPPVPFPPQGEKNLWDGLPALSRGWGKGVKRLEGGDNLPEGGHCCSRRGAGELGRAPGLAVAGGGDAAFSPFPPSSRNA